MYVTYGGSKRGLTFLRSEILHLQDWLFDISEEDF